MEDQKESESAKINQEIGSFGMWVNDHIVGNPITFVIAIISVAAIYSLLLFMPYTKWNTGPGLFYNTLSSSFELITGVGAVVGVVVLHSKHKKTDTKLDSNDGHIDIQLAEINDKINQLLEGK